MPEQDRYIIVVDENGTWKIDSQHASSGLAMDRLDALSPDGANTGTVRMLDTHDML